MEAGGLAMTIQVVVSTYCPEEWATVAKDDDENRHPRTDYLLETLKGLRDNLFALEPIEYILANDGPVTQEHVLFPARDVLDWPTPNYHRYQIAGGTRVGLGGSLNRALGLVRPDSLWMYNTDDWVLEAEYDLTQAVRLIREHNYGYVRLGPPHPNVMCTTKFCQGLGWWLELMPWHGGFAFGTRPFLATRRFYEQVGGFKEQCDAYEVELDYCRRVQSKHEQLRLAEVVSGSLEGPWGHVGEVEVGRGYP